MPSFTVHIPQGRTSQDRLGSERAVFVSDGWSWPAFIFGPFWLLWHRQWLGFAGYVVLWLAFTYLGRAVGLHPLAASLLSTLLNVALALEGGQIRRWSLARAGMPQAAVVSAPTISDAEVKYFIAAGQAASLRGERQPASSPAWPNRDVPVIGSFPEPGGR